MGRSTLVKKKLQLKKKLAEEPKPQEKTPQEKLQIKPIDQDENFVVKEHLTINDEDLLLFKQLEQKLNVTQAKQAPVASTIK